MRSLSLRSGNSPTTPYGGRVNGVGSRTGAPPVGSSESGPTGHVSSPRLVKRSMRISRTTLSCLLRVKGYVAVRVGSAFRAAHSSRVLLHLFQPCPQCFRWVQPSPSRISSVSGPAVRSAPFSSRLCLPCCQSHYRQRGRFPPPALPGFPGTTNPSATLSPVFPVLPVIRPTFAPPISRRGEEGFSSCLARPRHRAVATTPPECRSASASLRCVILLSSSEGGLSLPGFDVSGPPLRSLALRPGDSPTTLTVTCRWASKSQFPFSLPSKLRGSGSFPGGLVPR